jgi:hypothetical protein
MTEKTVSQIIGPSDGWIQATNGENSGSLRHILGGKLKITQADSMPADDAAEMGEVSVLEKDFVYFGLGTNNDYLYVKATSAGVHFSVTPANE